MKGLGGICILKNSCYPWAVWIGCTKDVDDLVTQLSAAAPFPFHVYAVYEVSADYGNEGLKRMIERLDPTIRLSTVDPRVRDAQAKGFYAISAKKAYEMLQDMAIIHGDIDRLHVYDVDDKIAEENKIADRLSKGIKFGIKRKMQFRFSFIGLKPGDEVQFKHDPSQSFKILNDKEVEYDGLPYTLSALAVKLAGGKHGMQGPANFTYKGEVLDDIRTRMEEKA